jgi:hypothetical protein
VQAGERRYDALSVEKAVGKSASLNISDTIETQWSSTRAFIGFPLRSQVGAGICGAILGFPSFENNQVWQFAR